MLVFSFFVIMRWSRLFVGSLESNTSICLLYSLAVCNGNRTERSPIRAVIIRVITKSDDRAAGVRVVYHDYRLNWTTRSLITN